MALNMFRIAVFGQCMTLSGVALCASGCSAPDDEQEFAALAAVEQAAAPSCNVVLPAAGSQLAGPRVVLDAAASSGATGVDFYLGSTRLGKALPTIYGWLFTPDEGASWGWDSRSVADGAYNLSCRARDASGATASSAPLAITVDNTAPQVYVALPKANDEVSGQIQLVAGGSDNVGISPASASFVVDGTGVGSGPCSGFGCVLSWDASSAAQGRHTVTASLRDAAGNTRVSAPVSFIVASKCLAAVPAGPADYQTAFDARHGGWLGSDGAHQLPLPDGRILWLFGDTFTGEADANNVPLPGFRLYGGNSAIVQSGRCFTPLMGGSPGARSAFVPSRVAGSVYWPSEGYVDTTVNPPVLRVWTGVVTLGASFKVVGADVFTLSLPGLALVSRADAPPPESLPNVPNVPQIGTGSVLDDGAFVYFYGGAGAVSAEELAQHPEWRPWQPGHYVARATKANAVGGPWEYWTGSGWSATFTQAGPIKLADGTSHFVQGPGFAVVRYGAGYLLTGKQSLYDWFGPGVNAWYARAPQGPWHAVAQVIPSSPALPGSHQYYGGRLITNVPGAALARPMMNFSINTFPCGRPDFPEDPPCTRDNDFDLNVLNYGPRFVAPQNLPTPEALAARFPG
jgi:hypothetical protein